MVASILTYYERLGIFFENHKLPARLHSGRIVFGKGESCGEQVIRNI